MLSDSTRIALGLATALAFASTAARAESADPPPASATTSATAPAPTPPPPTSSATAPAPVPPSPSPRTAPTATTPPQEPSPGPGQPPQAEPKPTISPKDTQKLTPSALAPSMDHRRQFGLEVSLGTGLQVIKPYADIWCGSRSTDPDNPNDPFCVGMSPLFLDVALSYGVTSSLDILAHFRYGLLEDPVPERHPIIALVGTRFWFGAANPFKWSVGLEVLFDFTKQDGSKQKLPTYGKPEHDELDVGGRIVFHFQYDFMRYLGVFGEAAGVVGALRWLSLKLEGSIGIQARIP